MKKQFAIKSAQVLQAAKSAAKSETANILKFLEATPCCSEWDLSEPKGRGKIVIAR